MFLLAGISSKVKESGVTGPTPCPACQKVAALHVCHKYMTPHIFFIPTFRFHSSYWATCPFCASIMELDKESGRAVERGERPIVGPSALHILQNNAASRCTHCGQKLAPGAAFCQACGERL